MPKVTGIFEKFDNLDQIPIEDISRWLKPQPLFLTENFLANKILYPQVIPIQPEYLEIELAILREILRRSPNYYLVKEKKITIPEDFLQRFSNLHKLIWIFIDSLKPKGMVHIMLGGHEVLGTYMKVDFTDSGKNFEFSIEDKKFNLKKGQVMVVASAYHSHISFKSKEAKVDGKNEAMIEIAGNKLGLVLDGRIS